MASLNSEERSLRAQIAANTRWARSADRSAATLPARKGLRAKFAREIDPDGTLPLDELERRVASMTKAHMLRMTLKAKQAKQDRRARAESKQ